MVCPSVVDQHIDVAVDTDGLFGCTFHNFVIGIEVKNEWNPSCILKSSWELRDRSYGGYNLRNSRQREGLNLA